MSFPRSLAIIGVIFVIIFAALLPSRITEDPADTFLDDGSQYNAGAVHLLQDGMYSLDGKTPLYEREPGYSFFIAVVYAVFGIENQAALFTAQGVIFLSSLLIFLIAFARITSPRTAFITGLLLVLLPPIYHIVFFPYRECLALSLLLLFCALWIFYGKHSRWLYVFLMALTFGYLILVYYPFVFFPIGLAVYAAIRRVKIAHIAVLLLLTYGIVGLWGLRNQSVTGQFQIVGSFRTTMVFYVRAEQAENVRGLEPFRCLWAEYVSRNWEGRSTSCSLNAVMHRRWPDDALLPGDEQVKKESVQRILSSLPYYIWFSVFEVLELHLPYVNGWGMAYNLLSILAMLILYIGIAFSVMRIWKREFAILFLFALYNTALFVLTDATPRYLLPVIFVYAAISAIGYDALLSRIALWRKK